MHENKPMAATLTTEQRKALAALAAGATKEAAAAAAGRSRTTVDRWLREDVAFIDAAQVVTSEALHDAGRQVAGLLAAVIESLRKDIEAGNMTTRDRIRCFDVLARHAVSLRQHGELEDRVTTLEQLTDQHRANGQPAWR